MDNSPESYICEDMAFEVLSWMPAKSVIRNSSFVLKGLMHERMFIRNQSINSSHCDSGFFLQNDIPPMLHFGVLPNESPNTFGIPKDSLAFFKEKARVIGSSQGLLLLRKVLRFAVEDEFLICNPVTKAFALLPPPKNVENLIRFGCAGFVITCDPRNTSNFPNDLTVVAPLLVKVDDGGWGANFRLAVYRNGKWDDDTCDLRVQQRGRELCMEEPVGTFSGPNMGLVVHYLCYSSKWADEGEPFVAAYDMEAKRLWMMMELPSGAWVGGIHCPKLRLLKWGRGEGVGLVKYDWRNKLTVWKLESYKAEGWRKVVDEALTEMGVPEEEGGLAGCSIVNDNKLLFATWKQVYLYDMEGVNARRLEVVGSHVHPGLSPDFQNLEFTLYANTLRPVCGHEISLLYI